MDRIVTMEKVYKNKKKNKCEMLDYGTVSFMKIKFKSFSISFYLFFKNVIYQHGHR